MDDFLSVFYPVTYNPEHREKVAKNLEAEAAWWRAGACDTCVTGLDCSVPGAGAMYFRGWDVTSWHRKAQERGLIESRREDQVPPSTP